MHFTLGSGEAARDAELGALAHGLMRDCQRCQHQHVAASLAMHLRCPLKLHGGLAHAAVGPDAELTNPAGHGHDVPLKRKQRRNEP